METLYPSYLMSSSNWFVQERHNSEWSREENKRFESALAMYDEDTPDRWLKVAAMVPGKTVYDVIKQYRELEEDVCEIEAGRVPIPGYLHSYDDAHRRRPPSSKGCDHERKKGVPWTEDEHRQVSSIWKPPLSLFDHLLSSILFISFSLKYFSV